MSPTAGPAWAASPADVTGELSVDARVGLDGAEVERRLGDHGPNRLRESRAPGALQIFVRQFASLVVALLAVAAGVALAFGEWLDGIAIFAVLAINSLIGFVTELRAVRSMEALRTLGSVCARVRREGRELELPAIDLVPGDVVLLEAGDVVTADLRLLEASKVEADESALTGESVPVAKSAEAVAADAPLYARSSMVFKGTALTRGSAESVVVATGMQTELGRIARLVQEAEPESTPLERRLASLGRWLIWLTVAIAALTTGLGIAAGRPVLLMIETGIALAVAAIPEGLPIVATMALARGMWRMARRNALVNRLSAVETLGATSTVFTDKTGTLTENRMTVRRIAVDGAEVAVEAEQEPPFSVEGGAVSVPSRPALRAALEAAVLCNNAALAEESGVGDPLELALLEAGAAAGIERPALLEQLPEAREEAFDTTTRMMATVHRRAGGYRVAVKGAADSVLGACSAYLRADGERAQLDAGERERWLELERVLADDGLRVLAVAEGELDDERADPYRDLTLLALVGLADPPRVDVRPALEACRAAGIRVVMVTGDHAGTAVSIARSVGLLEDPEAQPEVVLGSELGVPGRAERAGPAPLFARVTPEQKLDLIAAYQARGEVVAMTGDGVNDAPALRKADIGVAMGLRGTQVAREAADMVLTDDAFGSIVAAVEQGRVIFDNIRKFVFYLLSCNVSEVAVVALAAVVGGPLPLLPLQILFLNLVTDVFPALALSFGEGDPETLRRPPRDPREPILTRRGWLAVGGYGLVISVTVLAALYLAGAWLGYGPERAVTVSFLTLAFAQLWHVFNARSSGGAFSNEITRNRWVWGALVLCTGLLLASVYVPLLQIALRTRAPDLAGWGLVLGASLVPLVVGQAWRVVSARPAMLVAEVHA